MSWFKKSKNLLTVLLITVIVCSVATPVVNAATTVNKPTIGQIKIGSKSSVLVKNVQLIPSNEKQTLSYTLEFVNNESTVMNLFDYWNKVKLSNGVTVSPKQTNVSSTKSEISPKTSAQYTFVASVSRSTKFSDISIQVIKWDFSAPNYTRILGSIKVPATYTPVNNEKSVSVNDTKLNLNISNFRTYQLDEENRIEFDIVYTNQGYRAVTIPQYKYYFMTPDKYLYEVNPIKTDEVKIQPKAKATLKMKMLVPSSLKVTNGNISIALNDEASKVEVPIFTTQVEIGNTVSTEKPESLGVEKAFNVDDTKYALRLDSVQQLPFENVNIVSSTVTIMNKTSDVVSVPDLLGTYYLDGVEIAAEKVKKAQLSSGVGIPANGSIQLSFYMDTPYNNNYSKLKLELNKQTKTSSSEAIKEKITTYEVSKFSFKPFTKVAAGNDVTITTADKSTNYKIHSVDTYEGGNTIVYNVLLEVQNRESRASLPSKIVAYFKSYNGSYFPLKISEMKDKVNPDGKILMSLVATIPYSSNTDAFKLVLGEMIDDKTYLAATEFDLPAKNTSDTSALKGLNIYPYILDISAITIGLDRNANAEMYYKLIKNTEFDSVPEGHSIIMELVDGEQKYTKELKFETDLLIGTNQMAISFPLNIDNPEEKILKVNGFQINFYDQFEGKRKFLGTRMVYGLFIK